MIYKIIVDKQPMSNPSTEKKEYEIDIEPLYFKNDVYDSLVITKNEDYVIRRLAVEGYSVLVELDPPVIEPLEDVNIELFEGDNYIYLYDMAGNKIVAQYLVKNEFNELYVLESTMNSAINQKANEIELYVGQNYETLEHATSEYARIDLTTQQISSEVSTKVGEDELSTKIQQDSQSVQIAWNNISEFIKFINAQLQIKDNNQKLLMALDKTGQHFYNTSENIFGEMGVQEVNNDNFIAFSVNGSYGSSITNGMAWGIKTTSDNVFHPIFYIKNFQMGASSGSYGQLVLADCDLVLEGIDTGIKTAGVALYGTSLGGMIFENTGDGSSLLSIVPKNSSMGMYGDIYILDKIRFFRNSGGTNSFKIGTGNSYCLFTDDGVISTTGSIYGGADISCDGTLSSKGALTVGSSSSPVYSNFYGTVDIHGNVYANNLSSDKKIKKNIQDTEISALDIIKKIKHKQFDKLDDKKHYNIGYIAQEMEKIDPNFVLIREKTEKEEEMYYINELPIIATLSKAIQEQQEQIEELKAKDKQKDELLKSLLARIEKLEKGDK